MIERYKIPEIEKIWSEENKLRIWLLIEILTIEGLEKKGIIKKGIADKIRKKVKKITPEEVKEREKVTNHDVAAFVDILEKKVGREIAPYIHFGLTSSDLLDTTLAIQMKETLELIMKKQRELKSVLENLVSEYEGVITAGRTHGMFAEPMTLSHKFLSYLSEVKRNEERLKNTLEEISYGKLSGSVGNYLHIDPEIEKYVMKKLGLKPEPVSTQIVPRDRVAKFVFTLTLIASSLERIATEIRLLSRTEVGEWGEPFKKGQKGSSSMPHKKNPIISERICGMARILRGYLISALENIALWHERDISHSSVERIILPDASHLVYYMLDKMIFVLKNLNIDLKKIEENLKKNEIYLLSQGILYYLIEKGMERSKAYKVVQENLFKNKVPINEKEFKNLRKKLYNKLLKIEKILKKRIKNGKFYK